MRRFQKKGSVNGILKSVNGQKKTPDFKFRSFFIAITIITVCNS